MAYFFLHPRPPDYGNTLQKKFAARLDYVISIFFFFSAIIIDLFCVSVFYTESLTTNEVTFITVANEKDTTHDLVKK